ncbi:hypothetical protein THF1C08_310041 [Vibrio jasicida]|uniref:Uncharacterized protein n=1 Tax=Vibrio jasicida TaxID=766224 RepID=A0AAU9QSB2_9VIBR|nr:hypothetical protein THF1C08_310041 [Vibrio jasicida]CAH1597121.1 hypothetical protein THF1A12_310040 [Vibrio jasicida]
MLVSERITIWVKDKSLSKQKFGADVSHLVLLRWMILKLW